ncbi:hypothetical protein MLD38_016479 [Melastoma candidum]|uniref:Uncharacterized protein n=1 Tax=Melastoma candidum TaxID=119954 RepID=A0ACB9QML2_9MYRT|nr:hypothetical protein MLD38_016479 [Melastoma candidum]
MNGSTDVGPAANGGSSACCSCPICLSPIDPLQESFLDRCFHKFCYNCITRWVGVVAKSSSMPLVSLDCPICKTESFSIIHDCDGNSFLRDYIDQIFTDRGSAFFTEAHKYRLRCYNDRPGSLGKIFDVSRFWKSQRYRQSNRWLLSWLRRELQTLMKEEDVDIVLHHIYGVIDSSLKRVDFVAAKSPENKQKEFKATVFAAAEPFLAGKADAFADEVELFLASGLTIEAYDEVYAEHLGLNARAVAGDLISEPSVNPHCPFLDGDPDETD